LAHKVVRVRSAVPVMVLFCTALLLLSAALGARQNAKSDSQKSGGSPEKKQSAAPEQPVAFSHKIHITFQLPCQFCHTNPDPGNQMTIPDLPKCMSCHREVAKDKPAIKKLAQLAKDNQPIAWIRIYSVPAFVYWSHGTHLEAKLKCETCHGDVGQMEITTKATNVTTMGGCVDCHKRNNASTGCVTCHEGQG
jgi:hypothetical protein